MEVGAEVAAVVAAAENATARKIKRRRQDQADSSQGFMDAASDM